MLEKKPSTRLSADFLTEILQPGQSGINLEAIVLTEISQTEDTMWSHFYVESGGRGWWRGMKMLNS